MTSFEYIKGANSEIRNVEPYKLIYKNYNWYIYAFCLKQKQFRLFKLSRILNIKLLNENFNRNKDIPKIPYILEKNIKVILKFDKLVSYRVYDEFQHTQIVEKENSLYVNTILPDNNKLYSYILTFTNYVEIIEPEDVHLKFKEIIENLSKVYKT